ncbi:PPE family protein [Mycobacterium sp.]|uniref:PPE family protein n=1 Tax=Mycobacterium sp. TaxID=1785 RepID=UPI00128877D5|nr:PPE family protein [Mycobacterium sp.]KAA8964275.1 MAG: PPE family protein [Mycobacterium sp.]
MVFDFAARPPEVNSALMYSGAGAGPLMAASSAFNTLSAELSSNAASYESVISQLVGSEWHGPSAQAMATAAQPFIGWLHTTSAQLRQAALQAAASAAAYEAALAATIPPAMVAANRAQLAQLVATNILDRNAAAIAANEATYAEFWEQDAAAMYGYAANSAAAARLSPLSPPPQNTNPAGQGAQAAAVSNAVAGNAATAGLNGLLGELQNALGVAATQAQSGGGALLSAVNNFFNVSVVQDVIYNVGVTVAWNVAMMTATFPMLGHFLASAPLGITVGDITPLGEGAGMGMTLVSATTPAGGGSVMAGLGSSSSVGGLSVPAAWSAAAPAAETGTTVAATEWTGAFDDGLDTAETPGALPGMASATGRPGHGFSQPRYGVKPKVMPKQVLV